MCACRLLIVLEWRAQLDGDVKYFLKKKSAEAGPRPLWELTCHGDDNCQSVVVGDTSYEELKLQVSPYVAQSVGFAWSGNGVRTVRRVRACIYTCLLAHAHQRLHPHSTGVLEHVERADS